MDHTRNPQSIKYHVRCYLEQEQEKLRGQVVVDLPAGNGVTTRILRDLGADPQAFDLFPEYFEVDGVECKRANVLEGIPMDDATADMVICQEGIEHFTDQFKVLREFNRLLRPNGLLVITTPNYSNLRARLSYFLSESERFNSIMPPNEIDSIWMNDQRVSSEVYFGHVFLIGIQKLRVLATLAGFRIRRIRRVRVKPTSVLLFPFAYPFILLSNLYTYARNVRKDKGYDRAFQRAVYKEVLRLAIDPVLLVDGHLFVEFEKVKDADAVMSGMKSVHRSFGTT
jgi:SAM-dependent methyltransferase